MQGLNPLVDKIRAAHPGAYDDMDDATLTKSILAKYPQYEDLAAPHVTAQVPIPDMQQSTLGNLQAGPTGSAPNQTLPSPKGQMADQTVPSPAVGAVTVGSAAAIPVGMGIEAAAPAITAAVESHPIVAKLIEKGLEAVGVGGGAAAAAKLFKLFK